MLFFFYKLYSAFFFYKVYANAGAMHARDTQLSEALVNRIHSVLYRSVPCKKGQFL